MNRKQILAVSSPILVLISMYPSFRLFTILFPDHWRISWILGLITYWLVWGIGYPVLTIGRSYIKNIIKPQKLGFTSALLVLFPLIMAIVFKFIPGSIKYDKPDTFILIIFVFSTFGNGFFEEIYWRGVFMKLFPKKLFFRIIWPSIFFGLWHYIPGSLNPDSSHVTGLMIGAVILGLYSGFLAWKTNTLWWSILVHFFGGLIVIF